MEGMSPEEIKFRANNKRRQVYHTLKIESLPSKLINLFLIFILGLIGTRLLMVGEIGWGIAYVMFTVFGLFSFWVTVNIIRDSVYHKFGIPEGLKLNAIQDEIMANLPIVKEKRPRGCETLVVPSIAFNGDNRHLLRPAASSDTPHELLLRPADNSNSPSEHSA